MAVMIRPRDGADFDSLLQILQRVHAKSGYPVEGLEQPNFLVGSPVEQSWVAVIDGRIVGQIVITASTSTDLCSVLWKKSHPDDAVAVLGRLFVDPDIQSRGVAAKLMDTATKWSRQKGKRLLLFAVQRDARAAMLYQKLGWIQFGQDVWRTSDGREWPAICFASPVSE